MRSAPAEITASISWAELGFHGFILTSTSELVRTSEIAFTSCRKIYCFGECSDYIRNGAIKAGMKEAHIFVNKDISSPDLTAKQVVSGGIANIAAPNATIDQLAVGSVTNMYDIVMRMENAAQIIKP